MKRHRWARRLLLLAAVLGSGGCASVQEHRARQFKSTWEALAPAEQARLRDLTIAVGDSPKAVYFALGTPNYALRRGPFETVWVYWGIVLAEAPEAAPPTVRFASRGELRLPRPGEQRLELRVHFEARAVRAWELGPVDLPAAAPHRPLPMGAFPSIP